MPDGARVGPYRLLRRLASGGMGTVWVGRCDTDGPVPPDQDVAIKVVKAGGPEDRIRFAREARYLQGLHHPGIVRVLDTGEDEHQAWLVMPLIEGRRLDDLGNVAPLRAAHLVVQALEALHVAHLAGILHRDIKPGNLMLDRRDRVVLLDFGLAAAPDLESRLTREGDIVGTPAYMAPEQAAGRREDVGRRTDLYAMGAVLYELLTGRQPFTGETTMATLRAVLEEPLVPPRRIRPELPRPLEQIILVAMAREPGDRYRTAEEMAADLRRWTQGQSVRARPPSRLRLGLRSLHRHRRTIAAMGLAGFIILAGSLVTMRAAIRHETQALATTTWVAEVRTTGESLSWRSHAPLQAEVGELPPVSGPVRLTVQVPIPSGSGWYELMVTDRDVARGYRLRFQAGSLQLLRGDRIIIQRELEVIDTESPVTLVLTNDDGNLKAMALWETGQEELSFDDLVPLQGADVDGVWIAMASGMVKPGEVTLERRQTGEFVSALARADLLRQDGRYARAQALYERFLRDQPTSPQARDARLRLALCLESQGDREKALAQFQTLSNDEDPRYALVATFHAWSCAISLGRFRESEAYFTRIRKSYDLPALAATIPQSTLRDLRRDYTEQGRAQAANDPERAADLFFNAAELAGFLDEITAKADALTAAGDLLLALDRPEAARETWRRTLLDQRLDRGRRLALLFRASVASRLASDADAAALFLAQAVPLARPGDEARRLALWQGDLLAERDELTQAVTTWQGAGGGTLGRRLQALANYEIPAEDDPSVAAVPEGPWMAARTARLVGDTAAEQAWLQRAAADPLTWPGALARLQLRRLVP